MIRVFSSRYHWIAKNPKEDGHNLNLVHEMKRNPLNMTEFQNLQNELDHSVLLDMSVAGCSFEDFLAELLGSLRMVVVLDRQTSFSRTCWLSGELLNEPVLIVLDGIKSGSEDHISVDAWSNLSRVDEAIIDIIANTRIGDVETDFSSLEVNWKITTGRDGNQLLTIEISIESLSSANAKNPIFFTIDYQGLFTEDFEVKFSKRKKYTSIVANLNDSIVSWSGKLKEPYLCIHVSDAPWKKLQRFHQIVYTWEDALKQQIELKLTSGSRFESLDEFSKSLNMNRNNDSALRLFTEFCLNQDLRGCTTKRVAAHCARAVILTGLMACFNPPRGLSGYLEMVTGTQNSELLKEFGNKRTWRSHISQIAQESNDFSTEAAQIVNPKRERRPGRPPTQLVPAMHPLSLFNQYLEDSTSIVCKHCRFNNRSSEIESPSS